MHVERPRTRALFDQSCREVEAAGHRLTPQEAVWLYAAAEKVTREGDASPRDFMPPSVSVGGVTLRELSMSAHIWLDEYAGKWWEGHHLLDTGSVAFACVHGQTPGYLARLTEQRPAERKVYAMLLRVTCPIAELKAAVRRVLRLNDTETVDLPSTFKRQWVDPGDWGGVIAALSNHYPALPPEHVMALPQGEILRLLDERNRHRAGEAVRVVDGGALAALRAVINHLKAGGDRKSFDAAVSAEKEGAK